MTIQVFGIPNCGTCKKALKWLEENKMAYEFILVLTDASGEYKYLG